MNLDIFTNYLTGIKEIDDEHRSLFVLMNLINQLCVSGKKAEALQEFRTLLTLTLVHFEHEERLMEQIQFPYIAYHKQQHKEIQQNLEKLIENFGKRTFFCMEVTSTFSRDFLMHVDHYDLLYSPHYERYLQENSPLRNG